MLAEQHPVRAEQQGRAVQRSSFPLDHPDDEMERVVLGNLAEEFAGASRNFDSVLEISAKDLTALWGANADADAEIVTLGIATDERLGKNDEFSPLSGRICRERSEFLE